VSHDEISNPIPESDLPPEDERLDFDAAPNGPAPGAASDDSEEMEFDVESVANSLAADLGGLQAQLEEAQNRALRSSAELENYRRRANRQMEEERRYANLDLVRDLLPIWDNMGRAVEAAEKAGEAGALLEGFKMVYSQLTGVFEQYHCVKIDPAGEPFDPHLHEAISQMPSADHPGGTVLHVVQVGFQLYDRVVRPCQVVVSAAPLAPSPNEPTDDRKGPASKPAAEDSR
jgi:molecular chaperone GrpE